MQFNQIHVGGKYVGSIGLFELLSTIKYLGELVTREYPKSEHRNSFPLHITKNLFQLDI